MRVLVLNRILLSANSYQEWLGPECSITLITAESALSADPVVRERELECYAHAVVIPDYDSSPLVELEAYRLHRAQPFDLIVTLSEYDILRAARLRDVLGVPGHSEGDALAFRDKLRMKDVLSAAGVPVADYRGLAHTSDVLSFIEDHGYPVVVKPRRAAGSLGVHVLRDEEDLVRCLAASPELGGDCGADLIGERFVEHELIHVDGLVHEGVPVLIWPSSHGRSSTLGFHEGAALASAMLERTDPRWQGSVDLVTKTLAALPTPDTTLFHAEVFLDRDGRYFLNEIGCRIGGAKVHRTLRAAFGFPLLAAYLGLLAGRVDALSDADADVPDRLAGWLVVPPSPGVVTSIPDACDIPGVEECRVHARPGDRLAGAASSVDAIMSAVVCGTSHREVENLLADVEDWFRRSTVVEASQTADAPGEEA